MFILEMSSAWHQKILIAQNAIPSILTEQDTKLSVWTKTAFATNAAKI